MSTGKRESEADRDDGSVGERETASVCEELRVKLT